jgi:VanZ family protein
MLKRRIFWTFAAVAVFAVITLQSSQDSETSNVYSLRIARAVYEILPQGKNETATITAINLFIRKLAHFSVYAVITVFLLAATDNIRVRVFVRYLLILAIIAVLAGMDEFHQRFSGRHASVIDVVIDISGAVFVFGVAGLYKIVRRLISQKNTERE